MAELSQDELKAIRANPMREELVTFRTTFKSKYLNDENANLTEIVDQLTSEASYTREKDIILDLILALLAQPAARTIHSRIGNGPLSGDIASFYARLSADQEKAKHVAPLLNLVLIPKNGIAPENGDADIWTAVLDLIVRTRQLRPSEPTTPPQSHPSFASSFQPTPWSFNTGSFADASEHRKQVDDVLREELLPTLRIDIPDFIPTVFGHIPRLDELADTVFDRCQEENTRLYTKGNGWTEWPSSAKEDLVLKWLQKLMERFMVWATECGVHPAGSRQIYRGPRAYLDGSPIKRKMDVGVMARQQVDHGITHKSKPNWAQMLVTGELKSNPIEDGQEPAWLDLARYAREVFRTQDRRFVLGFTLCGYMMRLWHFDRSGSSGSSSFDINQDGLKFVRVMLGYHLMDDKQLGIDPTIQQLNGQHYVEITRDDKIERLILTEEIRKHAVVVGRATACWRAHCDKDQSKRPLIVKKSWQYEGRLEEGELIKEATNKGVNNIARYYHHETVQVDGKNDDTIGNVRRGLMKNCGRRKFKQRSSNEPDALSSEPPRKRHESSLEAGILHRDISIGNIMLTEDEDDGFLIDYDLAIKTSSDRASGAPGKTGTKVFMAIGALLSEPHSFMHDLESFFWVLFWICMHYDSLDEQGEVKRRIVPEYEKWNYAGTKELANLKRGLVVEEADFDRTIAGFTPGCKSLIPCVQELRKYTFPDGKRWLGENRELYSQIKAVLDKAREDPGVEAAGVY